MKTLTARRVRRARKIVAARRCPAGGRHDWEEAIVDFSQFCPPAEWICTKCGAS